ncbi:MAG: deoxyribose-phosphate aldolase [Thermoleophilia bacterium]|nr:deoxyribose-phosphate aldolase [Thermoleophilia bacterium]
MRIEELAKTIDSTLLEATATVSAVETLCRDAMTHHFASVYVLPYFVPLAKRLLQNCDVKVGTVVSFPFGADSQRTKITAAEQAVAMGADEIDVVLNIPAMLSGDFRYVRDELRAVVRAVRMSSVNTGRGLVLVKANVEAYYLDEKLKRLICKIVEDSGADFIKTSTGFAPGGATAKDVELFRDLLPEGVGVDASGGICTAEQAELMINAGAARIGTSHAVEIIKEFAAHKD